MPTMSQNKRTERESIIQWILTLEQQRILLDGRFERFRRQVEMIILSFLQEQGVDSQDSWTIARKRITNRELGRIRRQIDELLAENLTENARIEAEKLKERTDQDIMDALTTLLALETIRLMNEVDYTIDILIQDTIKTELNKQALMIDYDRQYFENHFEDIYRQAMTQNPWSAIIWGLYQQDLRANVERLVREAFVRGYNPKTVAEELQTITGRTKYEAERLMRTETARVQAESQLTAYRAQGITKYDLIPEPTACDRCKDVAKQNPHLVSEAEIGVNLEPIHPNCRCSTVGIID